MIDDKELTYRWAVGLGRTGMRRHKSLQDARRYEQLIKSTRLKAFVLRREIFDGLVRTCELVPFATSGSAYARKNP
jgi:hypothetical protein